MRLKRLQELERRVPREIGKSHRIIQREGESLRDAVQTYGADKIGENDTVIVRSIVSPAAVSPGSSSCRIGPEEWREACAA